MNDPRTIEKHIAEQERVLNDGLEDGTAFLCELCGGVFLYEERIRVEGEEFCCECALEVVKALIDRQTYR